MTLARRLSALEGRRSARRFRRVVIVGPGDVAPADSADIHIIRICAATSADVLSANSNREGQGYATVIASIAKAAPPSSPPGRL